jgi:hypothetical protein
MFSSARMLFVLLLVGASGLFAQGDRGTITGTVTDPAGAVVPGAAIEVRNSENGSVYQTASTATGNYTMAQVPPGSYEMTVTAAGFKKYIRRNIAVEATQTERLDVGLEVGAANESITVSGEISLLKTESGELSHDIEAQHLVDLGLLGIGGTFHPARACASTRRKSRWCPAPSRPARNLLPVSA